MTLDHILPAGPCAAPTLPLGPAGKVTVGECVRTVSGRERVVGVTLVEGRGVYTLVTSEEYVIVNGIIATPFGGVNPTLANAYYNLHRLAYALFGQVLGSKVGWFRQATDALWHSLV